MFKVGDKVVWAHEAPNTIFEVRAILPNGKLVCDDEWGGILADEYGGIPAVHFRLVTPTLQAWHEAIIAAERARSLWQRTKYPAETCRDAFEAYVNAQREANECAIRAAYETRGEMPPEA